MVNKILIFQLNFEVLQEIDDVPTIFADVVVVFLEVITKLCHLGLEHSLSGTGWQDLVVRTCEKEII